ncbi:MAG: leucine-rich repeat protein, partial [Bacteroidaceae bacterium]
FDGCAKLKTINNLKGFTNITDFYNAFWGCTELTSVTLPKGTSANSISFINAFNLCAALTTVDNLDLFTNVTSFSNVFWGCKALGEVNFGAFTQGIILTAAFGDANTSCVKYVASNEDKVTAEAAGWTNVYVRRATNIEKDSAASGLLFSTSADGKTVIESSKVRTISIFSINGQEIDKILLHEGANILDLEKGIYIIEGTKIAF